MVFVSDEPARYRRLMEFFEQVVALPDPQRSARLTLIRAAEPSIADELRRLLAHDRTPDDFFDGPGSHLDAMLAGWDEALADTAPAADVAEGSGPDPLIGSVIADRYRLDERLGAGGMGQVYRAFDRAEEREIAIKLLRPELTHDDRQVQRFRREFRAVSRLSHPGCLMMFAEGCHQHQRYIAMEYVRGGNLDRLSRASPGVLLPVLIQLAEALDYVHGCRILHRDLKPANVLLVPGDPPAPKLADFGIVHLVDDDAGRLTDSGALLGSIDFLAPESVEGKALDPRCDLYALGCVIYSLWTGQPPFLGNPFQRLRARLEQEAPALRALAPYAPKRLDALVARLLRRERAERPRRASEVAHELASLLAEISGGAAPTSRGDTLSRPGSWGYLYRPGLIGRTPLVNDLVAKVEALATGRPSQLLAVIGAAGMGKTMVVDELGRLLLRGGGLVLSVACRGEDLTAFAPFPQVIAVLDKALGNLVPDPRPGTVEPRRADPGEKSRRAALPTDRAIVARKTFAREIADKLIALNQRAPVVLVLEDLHNTARGAIALLEEVLAALDGVEGRRPVLVATARPTGREPHESVPLSPARMALIPLTMLEPEAVRQIAAAMLASSAAELPESLVPRLVEVCGGNPLWVQSAVRALVERGQLRQTDCGWSLDSAELSLVLSGAIGDLLRAELVTVKAPAREVLTAAALVGDTFDLALLTEILGLEEGVVIDAVDWAMRGSFIRSARSRAWGEEYAFEHDLVAEVLRADASASEHTHYHTAIGAVLERRGTSSASVLAFHFARGTDRERAFRHLRQAGLDAFDAHDYEAACRLLSEALERLDGLPEDTREPARIACTETLADALLAAGRPRESIAHLRTLCAEPTTAVIRARWLRKFGIALLRTPAVAEGLAALEQALAVLGDSVPSRMWRWRLHMAWDALMAFSRHLLGRGPAHDPASAELAVLHRELALMHRWIDLDRAVFHQVAFVRLAGRLGVDAYRMEAYLGTAFMLSQRPMPRLAAFCYRKARALACKTDDRHGLARYEVILGGIETLIGRDERVASAHFAQGLHVAETLGDRFLINFALTMRGWAGMLLGHAQQAIEDFRRAGAIAAELDIPWLRDDTACGLAMIEVIYGEPGSSVRTVLASNMRLALPVFEALPNEILGTEAFIGGRFREAIAYFERARAHYAAHHLNRAWGTMSKLAHGEALVCLADEEGPHAVPEFLDKLRSNARMARRLSRLWVFRGWGSLLSGVYRARCGDERAARALFASALAERGEARGTSLPDLWFKVRIAFERWRFGDPKAAVAPILDEVDTIYTTRGFAGMSAWLQRMRAVHRV